MLAIAADAPKTGSLVVLSFALDRKAENAFLPIAVFRSICCAIGHTQADIALQNVGSSALFHLLAGI
ncbi:hypothetical protein FXV83_41605 [Bradyrhizobium hipponense]|uniref:Uncharacterized protein n=1 Tax=Bradyrhizobium hipponense TaxID=2605638 RepID=A0A5S4Y8V4_9BRAD|nr:hypothetical protein [Bradyrhizobium hipponense]TYO60836.1 hypothetical protein FXV83_41605 [Bradyrhizobium hipponense]